MPGQSMGHSRMHHTTSAMNFSLLWRLWCGWADIVPVYSLGQSQMLDFWGSCALSRRVRAAVGIFWGRYGLPVPRRYDIIVAIGRPVPGAPPDWQCHLSSVITGCGVCFTSGFMLLCRVLKWGLTPAVVLLLSWEHCSHNNARGVPCHSRGMAVQIHLMFTGCVCGDAVIKKLSPSLEELREVQKAVLDAVTSLFDEHKHLMPGWEGKCLEIV